MELPLDSCVKRLGISVMIRMRNPNWMFALLLLVIVGISRPDIRIAMTMIENAYLYPEGDTRVVLASKYLIWSEHQSTYGKLRDLFWGCRNLPREAPSDPYDYTAIQAAEILGSYSGDEAMDALVDIVSQDYAIEGTPGCAIYAIDGLTIQGDEGYLVIENIATGQLTRIRTLRLYAIKKLGESMNPNHRILLKEILQVEDDEYIRTTINVALDGISE